ncbi:hypothetical protein [Anaeromyxobacter oryzae]|uniref:Lipoprotein n=1 Tax=Anaeromyxobacter oryzae TaxID=2918170 RepID=A0ABM7WSU7_9BACT|nr:hypothetical protein [Anaeromyxobacter oryzae]BDG02546.1 hypothetical protein AMOR_15420 [Anaeromyxobacter oryzae]
MIPHDRAVRLAAATALFLGAACATGSRRGVSGALAPPGDRVALGLVFGQDRAAVERALDVDGIGHRVADGDPDVLVADRCSGVPAPGPCRLLFGEEGLYAGQVEVPAAEEGALVDAVAHALGPPARRGDGASVDGLPALVATWERPAWSVGVSRHAPKDAPAVAVLHVQWEPAAPPVAAGVPLGRQRVDVEHLLDRQGATVVQRDSGSTTYLGCPGGAPDVVSCVVTFRRGRAAEVTEVHPTPPEDRDAMAAWRELSDRLEAEIGRTPARTCPDAGPDRIAGDCTATWATDRLVVVVGAHRNAGARHRGTISVYTGFTYPPLAAREGEPDVEASSP